MCLGRFSGGTSLPYVSCSELNNRNKGTVSGAMQNFGWRHLHSLRNFETDLGSGFNLKLSCLIFYSIIIYYNII